MRRMTPWIHPVVTTALVTSLALGACKTASDATLKDAGDAAPAAQAGAHWSDSADWRDTEMWAASMRHSADFFVKYAWDQEHRTFVSEVAANGDKQSDKIYVLALSRLIYGLAHASTVGGENGAVYLTRARDAARFLREKMVRRDARGLPYFVETVDVTGAGDATELTVNYQAYGLCGLVALQSVAPSPEGLRELRGLYDAFVARFYDRRRGGFYDKFDLAAQRPTQLKSYNSTVYVATSFLMELHRVDAGRRAEYAAKLREIGDRVVTSFVDARTGWLVENFDADWRVSWRDWQKRSVLQADGSHRDVSIGVGGHNTQAAWLLMRLVSEGVVTEPGRSRRYRDAARTILDAILAKRGPRQVQPGDDAPPAVVTGSDASESLVADGVNGGFFDSFQRETNVQMWHTNKPWWQQAEALMALTLALKTNLPLANRQQAETLRDSTLRFYLESYIDRSPVGGEFAEVDRNGQPNPGAGKGQAGKSAYHTVELARYMRDYAH